MGCRSWSGPIAVQDLDAYEDSSGTRQKPGVSVLRQVVLLDPMYDAYGPMARRAGGAPRIVPLDPETWCAHHLTGWSTTMWPCCLQACADPTVMGGLCELRNQKFLSSCFVSIALVAGAEQNRQCNSVAIQHRSVLNARAFTAHRHVLEFGLM